MKELKIGIIGAGGIAQRHLEVLAALPGVSVVGVTSRTQEKAAMLAKQFGVPSVYASADEMVERARPDALMLLVSAEQMFDVALKALAYRLPLFIEKPAGLTPADTLKLAEAADKLGVPCMVGYNRRFYSVFHKGIEIIRQHGSLLGVYVEGHERMWRVREGGKASPALLDQWIYANGTHTIDLLRFFGGEVSDVKSVSHRKFGEAHGDQFAAVMDMSSGAIGQYQAHWYSPGGWKVVLYGEGVSVEFKPLESGRWTNKQFETFEIDPDERDKKYKPGFYRQMEAFVDLVRTGRKDWPLLDLRGAYQTMLLAEKLSLSGGK